MADYVGGGILFLKSCIKIQITVPADFHLRYVLNVSRCCLFDVLLLLFLGSGSHLGKVCQMAGNGDIVGCVRLPEWTAPKKSFSFC